MFKTDYDIPLSGEYEYIDEKTALLNIETTGLSYRNSFICMAAISYIKSGSGKTIEGPVLHCRVFIAGSRRDEADLLEELSKASTGFSRLLSYGGNSFLYHFTEERYRLYHDEKAFSDSQEKIDILDRLRPYRHILPVSNLKKDTVERAVGYKRQNIISGHDLVRVYQEWEREHSDTALSVLCSHLREDFLSLSLLSLYLSYDDLFCGRSVEKVFDELNGSTLTIRVSLTHRIPLSLSYSVPWAAIEVSDQKACINVNVLRGRLKYFLPGSVSDYYYLPEEDIAVHKSVGQFVDRKHRKKATKETCFTAVEGIFLPSPEIKNVMLFRNDYYSDKHYILYDPENRELLLNYVYAVRTRNKGKMVKTTHPTD